MFEKLTQMLQNLQNNQNLFDPAQFEDPVALQTEWGPARGGGNSFRTYKLVEVNSNRMEFKTTLGAILFALIFAVPGTGLLIMLIPNIKWSAMDTGYMIPLILGLVFTILGWYMLYSQLIPIVFDKQEGFFWKSGNPKLEMLTDDATTKYARLEMIHALQVVVEYISGKNGGYYSYELNLVLKDGRRINVVDHSKKMKLAAEADALAEFLGVPVWDATISRTATDGFSV